LSKSLKRVLILILVQVVKLRISSTVSENGINSSGNPEGYRKPSVHFFRRFKQDTQAGKENREA